MFVTISHDPETAHGESKQDKASIPNFCISVGEFPSTGSKKRVERKRQIRQELRPQLPQQLPCNRGGRERRYVKTRLNTAGYKKQKNRLTDESAIGTVEIFVRK